MRSDLGIEVGVNVTEYRRQHFVPVSYLRSFSVDPAKRNRGSKVMKFSRCDRVWSGPVKAERECYYDDHYSESARKEFEKDLGRIEQVYSDHSRKVYEEGFSALTDEERYNLPLTILLLFVRNPIHRHYGVGGEEADRVKARYPAAIALLAPDHADKVRPDATLEERLAREEEVQARWSLHEIQAPSGGAFITSDSPVIPVFVAGTGSRILAYLLPFDPAAIWVLADQDVEVTGNSATEEDVEIVNKLIAAQAIDAVYASAALDSTVIEAGFDAPVDLQSKFREDGWSFVPHQVSGLSWLRATGDPDGKVPTIVGVDFKSGFSPS